MRYLFWPARPDLRIAPGATNALLLIATLTLLSAQGGCIGPDNIRAEREGYNEAIAATSRQQLLLNLVRAHNNEMPQFVDVSQVINNSQLTASIGAQLGLPQQIAAVTTGTQAGGTTTSRSRTLHGGHDYQISPSIGGNDSPAITYAPLTGSALVTQTAQPISVDSIAALYDSEWPLEALLTFAATRLSLNPADHDAIIDDLSRLARDKVLTLAATKSPVTSGTVDDSLSIFVNLDHAPPEDHQAWTRLRKAYAGTYVRLQAVGIYAPPHEQALGATDPESYSIELRTVPTSQPSLLPPSQVVPLLRTRSALGVLIVATGTAQWVTFLSPDAHRARWRFSLNDSYVSEWLDVNGRPTGPPSTQPIVEPLNTYSANVYVPTARIRTGNPRIGPIVAHQLRHFIAIIESDEPPTENDMYVRIPYRGHWYAIAKSDTLSQRNFQLMGQLLTMQSIAPSAPPPAPTIAVGGH